MSLPVAVDVGPEPIGRERLRGSYSPDVAIVALIFVAATWVGTWAVGAFRQAGGAQYFYQSDFGPAVMLACGRGFGNPDTHDAPELHAYLTQTRASLDCTSLRAGIRDTEWNPFQRGVRYLELAVGLTWRLFGVSWTALDRLGGLLFALVAVLIYGILRLTLPRGLALAALLASVSATPNFMLVPHLRDYAKGPFLLGVILILGLLVRGGVYRRFVGLAALCGAVVGVGLGFRNDLLIALVPCLMTLALLVPRSIPLRERAAAIACFLATFGLAAFPILRDYAKGGNTGHVVLLGLASDFDSPLRVVPSVYEFGGRYLDASAYTTLSAYAIRAEGRTEAVAAMTPDYERVAQSYLRQLATTFPADVVTRTLAAIRVMPKYFLDSSLYPPIQLQSEAVRKWYPLRARILWRAGQAAFVALVLAALVLASVHLRAGCLVVLVLVTFAGTSAIQFHERHFFYLMFLPWWTFAFLIQAALRRSDFLESGLVNAQRALLAALAVFAVVGSTVGLSRLLQGRFTSRLFTRYVEATRTVIQTREVAAGTGRVLLAAEEWLHPATTEHAAIRTRFIAVTFRNDRCVASTVPITLRYDGRRADADLTETLTVNLAGAQDDVTLFAPTYDWADGYTRFRGFEFPAGLASCVSNISQVDGLDREPLLLTTALGGRWREENLYQRLR